MGRGTGHFRPLLLLLLSLLLLVSAFSRAASRAATWRKLSLRASALGHDRAKRMRRTARLEALLRARVSERPPAVASSESFLLLLLLLFSSPVVWGTTLLLYARDRETSAGAMQKSISFTLPRSPVPLLLLLLLLLLSVVVGISAERSDDDDESNDDTEDDNTLNVVLVLELELISTCSSLLTGGCSISAPGGVRNLETGAVEVRHRLGVWWGIRLFREIWLILLEEEDAAEARNGRCLR